MCGVIFDCVCLSVSALELNSTLLISLDTRQLSGRHTLINPNADGICRRA